MPRFRKKPVEIEAIQWTGDNWLEVFAFADAWEEALTLVEPRGSSGWVIEISTLEGVMNANVDDWIIRGVKGEFYPIKDEIFRITYEQVDHA